MKWQSLVSTQNLKLAWRRINTGRNLQYKRFFREAYLVYESAVDEHIKELHKALVAKAWQPCQAPLIYLATTAQVVRDSGAPFVFSNGHGLATFTDWFDNLAYLDKVDWNMVYQRYWSDTLEDMDRQRRKQAEFLVHRFCNWSLIQSVGVINQAMKARVEGLLADYPVGLHKPVVVRSEWYYY